MASDASATPSFPVVPGFDFLQALVKKNAGIGLPGFGQWVAPTLNPEELEKRIEELKTVQFWLEQNARMLGATIQALEVQRMTLSTLKTMNVQMTDLRDALTVRPPDAKAAPSPSPASPWSPSAPPAAKAADEPKPKSLYPMPSMFTSAPPSREAAGNAAAAAKPAAAAPPPEAPAGSRQPAAPAGSPPVDAMQWWNALTQQFTELATTTLRDTALNAQKLAGGLAKTAPAGTAPAARTAGKTGRAAAPGGSGGGAPASGPVSAPAPAPTPAPAPARAATPAAAPTPAAARPRTLVARRSPQK